MSECECECECECSIDSLLPIERAANARVVANNEKTSIDRRLSPARDSSPRTFDALCATRRGPTGVLDSKESRSDRSARAPARPRDDSADIPRDCPARSESVRSLPASIGRGSRACARTSCVRCRALRLALALAPGTRHPHPALGARRAALALSTRHAPSALNLGRRTVGSMESCRHQLVSSKRPKTPQPSSRGPVRADQFRRADDSAHIRSTCRLAAKRGQDGCAEHPDPRSRTLGAAHPDLGVASSASGGRRPPAGPSSVHPGPRQQRRFAMQLTRPD